MSEVEAMTILGVHRKLALQAGVLALVVGLPSSCAPGTDTRSTSPSGTTDVGPTPTSSPTGTTAPSPAAPGEIVVTGVLTVAIGDPPPGTDGSPMASATLVDDAGRRWVLVFADYQPSGGLLQYNLRRVTVRGDGLADKTIDVRDLRPA
jgi:hypothetical protein